MARMIDKFELSSGLKPQSRLLLVVLFNLGLLLSQLAGSWFYFALVLLRINQHVEGTNICLYWNKECLWDAVFHTRGGNKPPHGDIPETSVTYVLEAHKYIPNTELRIHRLSMKAKLKCEKVGNNHRTWRRRRLWRWREKWISRSRWIWRWLSADPRDNNDDIMRNDILTSVVSCNRRDIPKT